jgi:hypothetical protein
MSQFRKPGHGVFEDRAQCPRLRIWTTAPLPPGRPGSRAPRRRRVVGHDRGNAARFELGANVLFQNVRLRELRPEAQATPLTVPELTRNAPIKLNTGVSLSTHTEALLMSIGQFPQEGPSPHRQSRQANILRLAALFFAPKNSAQDAKVLVA